MRFKLIVAGLIGVFALYAAFWAYMANRFESELHEFAADEAAKGNEVHWETLSVTGFPSRMRAELGGVAYVQNVGRPSMRFIMTDNLVADILPYKLNHVILDFPAPVIIDQQSTTDKTARDQTTIAFDTAHMSVVTTDKGPRIGFEGIAATITGTQTGTLAATRLGIFMRPGNDPRTLDLYIEAEDAQSTLGTNRPYTIKAKASVEQGEILFQGLTLKDWTEVGGKVTDIDLNLKAEQFSIFAVGAAGLSQQGVLRAQLDTTVMQTQAFLEFIGGQQQWSSQNRNLIDSLVNMADLADGAADQRAKVSLVADERAVMAGPFRISDPVKLGRSMGF